jgi:hypothetical protein
MNERIKELIEQCTDRHFSECVGGYETFDKEKFAELIVREYETLLPEICPWDGPNDSPMKGWHVQFVARKHFGVEE